MERPRLPVVRVIAAAIGVLIGALVVFGILDAVITGDGIHRGVTSCGIAVGGLSRPEAAARLASRVGPFIGRPAELRYGAKRWPLAPRDFSLEVDYRRTADRAWRIGRDSNPVANIWRRLTLMAGTADVDVVTSANRDAVDAFLRRISKTIYRRPVDAALETSGTSVLRTWARPGIAIRPAAAWRTMAAAMVSTGSRTAKLPICVVAAGITDKAVEAALADAKLMVARPLHLVYGRTTWRVDREEVARWVRFDRSLPDTSRDSGVTLKAVVRQSAVSRKIRAMTKKATRPPRDARFKIEGEQVRIVPSRAGSGVDTAKAYRAICVVLRKHGPRRVGLVMGPIEPRLTTNWARASGITTLMGTYTTKYDPDATSRVNNIHLLLGQLNNTFVRPGGVFSFNKTIGPRTAEKGYEEAPAIIGGKLLPSLGGGVCQVGTTLFNSVFFSGLEVVERHNHSFYISHYPDGRDATVSWDGPDLKFKNDTNSWVMIKAWWGDDWVTLSLYGGDVDNEVAYRTSEFTNFVDPPMEKIEDLAMAAGTSVVEDEGIRGRDITVWRTVKRRGKVIHQDVFESQYEPKAGTTRVGAKPKPKPKPSGETTPVPVR